MIEQVENFLQISDSLDTGGQPSAEQLRAVRDAGCQTVINLAMPDSPQALPGEAELVAGLGMVYESIPVVWTDPKLSDLEAFFEAMARHQGKRVFIHCIKNYRVSCFVFLYRVIRLGVPARTASRAMHRVWTPDPTWRRFIGEALDRYPTQV
ncbi:MAG: protein tyrosine phosphatase family protein [Anaerolineae bacterium]|nr:protein tyrosine phosphatase family protein [Anaerolineae bacterium]